MSEPTVSGIHHVTAIAGDPQRNLDYYTQVLGLRLVKLTVNFDDPGTYHFYFGDAAGRPGSILTFFPWRGVPRPRCARDLHTFQSESGIGVESRSLITSLQGDLSSCVASRSH